jgi:hypothetical protein
VLVAFTVVILVVVATGAVAFFATGFFRAVEADFLVAMNFPPYKKYGFSIAYAHTYASSGTIRRMGLFISQQNTRTKLQEKIAAELAEKAKKKAAEEMGDRPDGIDDSAYLENTKKTTSLAWAWVLIALATLALLVWIATR